MEKKRSTHSTSHLCPFRLVLPFVPEMNTGRCHQNTFLTILWLLEIPSYVNSSFNIFIYYSTGTKYRETMKQLFCCKRVAARSKNTTLSNEQIPTDSAVSEVRYETAEGRRQQDRWDEDEV